MKCPYCEGQVHLVTGAIIYPHRPDLYNRMFYLCEPCNAYVGCHQKTGKPFGRLANKELRAAKQLAHKTFDPIWKDAHLSRSEAYAWLAEQMQISPKNCHIGMFDVAQYHEVQKHTSTFFTKSKGRNLFEGG